MDGDGVELRRRAVELAGRGWKPTAIGRELGRSREWVRRWGQRFDADGDAGLVDGSRRPHVIANRLDEATVAEVLAVRDLLEADRFSSVGPRAIAAEIERRGVVGRGPSLSSIKRILSAGGRSRPYRKRRRSNRSRLGLPEVTAPGVWQQADWVQDRMLSSGVRFSSLQISDVGSHMISSGQHRSRGLLVAVRQLTAEAWPAMSIPLALSTDNAFSKTSHPNNPWTIWIRVLLMLGVEAIVSPPNSLGFTNHGEAVNWLWQDRTINRYHYDDLDELSTDNRGFMDWANTRRAILDPKLCGTSYPAEYVRNSAPTLRWLPPGFDIDDYLDNTGTLRIPLTRGRITFLRHVSRDHTINIAHTNWPVPDSLTIGALVVAAINTATAQLEIRHHGELVHHTDYPTTPAHIDPYHPTPNHGLLDHLPTMS